MTAVFVVLELTTIQKYLLAGEFEKVFLESFKVDAAGHRISDLEKLIRAVFEERR